jgi:REP element-mobilizing transposase RayT
MLLQPYQADELRFAYCFHVYLRWSTHRRRAYPPLAELSPTALAGLAEPAGIRVLESQTSPGEVRCLVSLQPVDAVAACVGKLKGRVSKWLREALELEQLTELLAKGYFAVTAGKSRAEQVSAYLAEQARHHGYAERVLPPVFLKTWEPGPALAAKLRPAHAWTRLRLHVVFATWRRHGVFGACEGQAVAERWFASQESDLFALLKVSFLPDHVHLAVALHPQVPPARLAVRLMNQAQEVIWQRFPEEVIRARVERLWQPSAYVGSFGDLASPQIRQYIRNWEVGGGE